MTIKRKLFLITVLPTITILLFSVNHIIDKYSTYNTHENLLSSATLLDNTANVLHEIQIERGLISSYINNIHTENNLYFLELFTKQQNRTDAVIKKFDMLLKDLERKNLKIINKKFTNKITILLNSIKGLRDNIANNSMTPYNIFIYFSYINSQLLELAESIKFYSNNENIQDNIMILKRLLILQEISGQERGLVALQNGKKISTVTLQKLNSIWTKQDNIYENLKINLDGSDAYKKLNTINNNKDTQYIQNIRHLINNNNSELNLNSKTWFETTTNRINDYHLLGHYFFSQIVLDIKNKNEDLYNSFLYQVVVTIVTIMTLFFGVMLIARNINSSLSKLDNYMDNFFDFLNFKEKPPEEIHTDSNDELNDMVVKINKQISHLNMNLENDHKFIRETTQIVQDMHDGLFHKKSYSEPASPYLVNLKTVFNKLTELISNKITEQTASLEELNSTLEDKVSYQTAELERQILEITDARDAAIDAEKSKDIFLANMSHEIRTPLNAILGFVSILNKRIKGEKSLDYLSIIDSSGKSLLNVINDILDFSKIQSGKYNITPHNIDPMIEFSNTAYLFASKAYEKSITYAVYIDPNIPKEISVDEDRIKQILSNLLSNAIKFTHENGTVSVYIIIKADSLIMSVQDSGIGIPAESQTKIFNSFSQAEGSTTREFGGTGLGLSISLKLAQLMDGTINLISKEGTGSTFTLKVPITVIDSSTKHLIDLNKIAKYRFAILSTCKEHEVFTSLIKKYLNNFGIDNIIELSEFREDGYDILFFIPDDLYNEKIIQKNIHAISMEKSSILNIPNYSTTTSIYAPFTPLSIIEAINDITDENIRIIKGIENDFEDGTTCEVKFKATVLVAEDNKTNQLLISLILDDYNIDHHVVNNGKEAVELFKQKKFDLILMDENMPELNGLGAMKQIKEYESKNNLDKTPIIVVTANALITDVKHFLAEGMDGFVAKPINNDLLEIELHKHLKKV